MSTHLWWLKNTIEKAYDPVCINMDESPYYHTETEAQNRRTLNLRGSTVPIIEGESVAHSRWTAQLSCCNSGATVPIIKY